MSMDFRERKTHERAKRIARQIYSDRIEERLTGVKTQFPSMDAVVAPGGGGWQVPEPSKDALNHMAAMGFVPESETPEFRNAPAAVVPRAVLAPSAVELDELDLSERIAAGVQRALAAMGFKAPPAPVATNGAPPVNEDR